MEARSRRLGLQNGNSVGRAVFLLKEQTCRGVLPNEHFLDQKCHITDTYRKKTKKTILGSNEKNHPKKLYFQFIHFQFQHYQCNEIESVSVFKLPGI